MCETLNDIARHLIPTDPIPNQTYLPYILTWPRPIITPEAGVQVWCVAIRRNMHPLQQSTTCPHCRLIQFLTATGRCRRCKRQLGVACIQIPLPNPESLFGHAGEQRIREFFGNLLQRMRRRTGYSQTRFASAVGVGHRSNISRIEHAHVLPSLKLLLHVAGLLGIDRICLHLKEPESR